MASIPGASGSSGFSSRLAAAMEQARRGQAQAAAAAPASTPQAADDFSDRLRQAMAKARGEEPPEAQAPAAVAEEAESAEAEPTPESTGPVGMGERVVRAGDCITSIAKQTGHFWETIWNDPGNSELRGIRKDPNVLLPEDRVHVPELRRKEEPGQTEMRHRFRRLGEPAMLRIQILTERPRQRERVSESEHTPAATGTTNDERRETTEKQHPPREDRPWANVQYVLVVDGQQFSGTTDEDGMIEQPIPGNARQGRLILAPGTLDEVETEVILGHLSPKTELCGIKERLANLGFDCGERSEEETERFAEVLRGFQDRHGLSVTGKPDPATRAKLLKLHGS